MAIIFKLYPTTMIESVCMWHRIKIISLVFYVWCLIS